MSWTSSSLQGILKIWVELIHIKTFKLLIGVIFLESITIGQTVKNLRKIAGLSQKELAKDICSQAQICKIEKNHEHPSSYILNKLAKRLGVDMNYFFDIQETPRLDYLLEVKELVREMIRDRNYQKVYEIISSEKKSPLFQTNENKQFLLWHEAICLHYNEKKSEEALEQLFTALNLTYSHNTRYYTENEIEILNSIAIIQKDLKLYKESESNFRDSLKLINYIPKLNNKQIKIRLIYGLSKLLTDQGKYEESIEYCRDGILLCKKLETLYLFGELHYQLGSNFARLKDIPMAELAFNKAINIFAIQDNHNFVALVEKLRDELLGVINHAKLVNS